MSYQITITKIETKAAAKQGAWVVVEKRPWTDAELENAARGYNSAVEIIAATPLKEVMGYAPNWQGVETKETEMLKQTIEEIDFAAVIKAINAL